MHPWHISGCMGHHKGPCKHTWLTGADKFQIIVSLRMLLVDGLRARIESLVIAHG